MSFTDGNVNHLSDRQLESVYNDLLCFVRNSQQTLILNLMTTYLSLGCVIVMSKHAAIWMIL
jgi:hypothetical protein